MSSTKDFVDYYQKIENDELAVKKAARIMKYNEQVDEVRRLIPEIIEKITVNPPKEYNWITIEGKKHVSWSMYNDEGDSSAHESISILPDGKLISITRDGNYWNFVDYVYVSHIDESSEAAQEDYHGGCGYSKKYYEDRIQLGSWTLNGLCWSMSNISNKLS